MLQSQKLYFIALLPPEEIQDYANQIKQYFADHYGSRHAQKSPPHITLQPPFEWAYSGIPALEEYVERILERLTEISKDTFFLTQLAVVTALGQMQTPKAIGILQAVADQTPDGRVRRYAEEEISKVQSNIGSESAIRQLRSELDQLRQQNQELRSRLENLEAKAK
ncbi:MAG: hypothetical protein F6K28_10405 [Microcoleus sp. SIO2G3]|nr:hypothetical protein [Microcoleus sp. SIO2G3]